MKKVVITAILVVAPISLAWAEDACLYGSARWKDGSKIDGSTTVSTSYNSKKAFPKKGEYKLCFGSNPNKRVTVYLDGMTYAEVLVKGNTRFDIVRMK